MSKISQILLLAVLVAGCLAGCKSDDAAATGTDAAATGGKQTGKGGPAQAIVD